MTARELAEKLMEHPDDLVFIPMEQYTALQVCTKTRRDTLYDIAGSPAVVLSEIHREQFQAIGHAMILGGAV